MRGGCGEEKRLKDGSKDHTGDTLPYFTTTPLLKLKRQKIKTNYDIYKIIMAWNKTNCDIAVIETLEHLQKIYIDLVKSAAKTMPQMGSSESH